MGGGGRCLEPSSPGSSLLLARAVGLPRAALGGDGAPAAQPPAAPGEVRVPPRQERGVRGLQVPGPHPGVRRAGQPLTPLFLPPIESERRLLLLLFFGWLTFLLGVVSGDEQVQRAHGVAAGAEERGLLRGPRRGDR